MNAKRNLTVFPDDVFVVSYPRSGNTWMRFLIGNLRNPDDPVNFVNVASRIPPIYRFPDRVLRRVPRPRVLKSHEIFDPRYKTTIYVVRDPRDVAVSGYHFLRKWRQIPDGYSMDDFVSRFISGQCEEWEFFANWGDHVLSWLGTRQGHIGFLLLRYEDILQDPFRELAKVSALLNMGATPERLKQAVTLSSFDRMRKLEKAEAGQWKLTKGSRQDIPFVRSATSGGWQTNLSEKSVVAIEEAWGPVMHYLGYELTTEVGLRANGLSGGMLASPLCSLGILSPNE